MNNYYDILQVKKDASADDIKKAYRDLMKKYHPDVSKDKKTAEDKCKEINVAYETLSDPQKRKVYDNPQPNFGGNPFNSFYQHMDMNEMINHIFGGGNGGFQFHFSGNMGGANFTSTQTVHCQHSISIAKAIVGGPIDVDSPIGKVHFDLPSPTQPGITLTLQIKKSQHEIVIVKVKINVIIPSNLTDIQKKIISDMGV